MTARETESELLTRCASAARRKVLIAQDQREANIFRLASMVIQSHFPSESKSLMRASERYFAKYPDEKLAPPEVVRKGWVLSLPRLRDMLSSRLHEH